MKVDAKVIGGLDVLIWTLFTTIKSITCLIKDARGTSAMEPSEQIVTEGYGISVMGNPAVATLVTTGRSSQSLYMKYDLINIIRKLRVSFADRGGRDRQ